MNHRLRILVLCTALLALVLGSGAAQADQTPIGNLGAPTSTWETNEPLDVWISMPTAVCPNFMSGSSVLFFTGIGTVRSSGRMWELAPTDTNRASAYVIRKTKFSDSQSAAGYSYTLRADLTYSGYIWLDEVHRYGIGKTTVTRSDGSRMTGTAEAYIYADGDGTIIFSWQGTPTCT
jgi:hypothetical protein